MLRLVVGLAFFFFVCYCWWRILAKMGFFGWKALVLLLLGFIPGFGLTIGLIYLAFWDWPLHDELRRLERAEAKGYRRR